MLLDRISCAGLTTNFTRRGRSHRDQGVAVRHLGQSAAARAEALRMSRWYTPFFVIRPCFPLAIDAAVGHTFTFRAPEHSPAGLLAVAAEEHLLLWRRLFGCRWCVVLRQASNWNLHTGDVDGPGLLHGGRRGDGVSVSYENAALRCCTLRGQAAALRSREAWCDTLASGSEARHCPGGDSAAGGREESRFDGRIEALGSRQRSRCTRQKGPGSPPSETDQLRWALEADPRYI